MYKGCIYCNVRVPIRGVRAQVDGGTPKECTNIQEDHRTRETPATGCVQEGA